MVLVTALGSALFYALASVLQHRSASVAPLHKSMKPGLLFGLVRNPLWLLGIISDLFAFLLQFWALGHGPLILVQPLLVSGLLFALPLGAYFSRQPIPRGDLAGALAIVVGLSIFLGVARPSSGHAADNDEWMATLAFTLGPAIAVSLAAVKKGLLAKRRAEALAFAAGITLGLAAALIEVTAHQLLRRGFGHVFSTWQLYALIAVGILSLLLVQSAFQAGPLADSLPILTVVDPLASILIGAVALHEGIAHSPGAICLEVLGLALMAGGIMYDGKSELITHDEAGSR